MCYYYFSFVNHFLRDENNHLTVSSTKIIRWWIKHEIKWKRIHPISKILQNAQKTGNHETTLMNVKENPVITTFKVCEIMVLEFFAVTEAALSITGTYVFVEHYGHIGQQKYTRVMRLKHTNEEVTWMF